MKEYRMFAAKFIMVVTMILRQFFERFELASLDYSNDLKSFVEENERSNEDYSEGYVLRLLKKLFFQNMTFSVAKNRCVVYVALVICCQSQAGRFSKINEISRRVAKLLYLMKVTTLALVSSDFVEVEENNLEVRKRIEEFYLSFYNKNTNNPIISTFRISKFIASFGTEEKLPKVYWVLDSNYTCLQAGPTTVSIKDLQQGAKKGKNIIESFFTEKMMMNFHYEVPRVISDELNNSSDGFYFIHDKGNNFRGMQERFHSYLINKGLKNDIEGYISHWRRFIQLLIFNIHLTSGNPNYIFWDFSSIKPLRIVSYPKSKI